MKFLLIILSLCLSYAQRKSEVYMSMDISSVNPSLKDFPLMSTGHVNQEVLNFAKNIVIPSELNDTVLNWFTYANPPENYQVLLSSSDPTVLGVEMNYPENGTVPTSQEKFIISFTCHGKNNVLRGTQIHLQLKLWDKDGEFLGLSVSPRKACKSYSLPKCSVYPTTIELDKIPTKLSLLTLNIDSNIKNINSLEKLPHIYEKIKNYDVISLQNVGNNENRIGLIDLLINSHQYRIVAPRKEKEKESKNGLFLASKYPIIYCNYFILKDDVDSDENNNNEYGYVLAGINVGEKRTIFIVNTMFADELTFVYMDEMMGNVYKEIDEYKEKNKDYIISLIITGNLEFGSGTKVEPSGEYLKLLKDYKLEDLYGNHSINWDITDYVDNERNDYIFKSNYYPGSLNIEVNNTEILLMNSTKEYEFLIDNEIVKLNRYSTHDGVGVTFDLEEILQPDSSSCNIISIMLILLFFFTM